MVHPPSPEARFFLVLGTAVAIGIGGYLFTARVESAPAPATPTVLPQERGAWLWTGVGRLDMQRRNELFETARAHGIDTIYLSVNSYIGLLDTEDEAGRAKLIKSYDAKIEDFLIAAQKAGFAVDAVTGLANSAEPDHADTTLALLDHVIEFNASHTAKFRGFQYDVEPYTLDRYERDSAGVLTEYLNLIARSIALLAQCNLRFSVAIPDFYDERGVSSPIVRYDRHSGTALDHLLRLLAKRPGSSIVVMAYHDHAEGEDGVIAHAHGELQAAAERGVRVVVALEIDRVGQSGVSFYGKPLSEYTEAIGAIESTFAGSQNFGGTATDHLDALPLP